MSYYVVLDYFVSLVFSSLGVFITLRVALKYRVVDMPGARSSHEEPTPGAGGIGILAGIIVSAFLFVSFGKEVPSWPLWLGLAIIAAAGLWDDVRRGLYISVRLLAQLCAALLVAVFIGRLTTLPLPAPLDVPLNGLGGVFTVLWIMAVINIFNFMDGIDGMAGLQALITGLVLAVATHGEIAWLGATIAGVSTGFLFFNWQPAKIFMGDVGSYSLGYLLACAPFLQGSQGSAQVTMLVGLSMWLFLADASFTLVRRLVNRERVWEAHRSHLYQRLVITGFEHFQVAMIIGSASLLISVIDVIAFRFANDSMWWITFVSAAFIFSCEILFTRQRERRETKP